MDLLLLESAVVYTAVLICFTVSGQTCSSDAFLDPQNVESYDSSRLIPLLGRYETFGREQWIFFDLQFTCRGMLTKWIFRGLPDQDIGVELTTWRLNTRSNFFTSYDQVSTTERNAGRPTRNGAVFTYELISPVEVLPGDVVGIEMGFISFGGTSNNVIALNMSGSGSSSTSYRTSGSGPSFILQSPLNIRETDIIPLLQAVIEPAQESTTPPTNSPQATTTKKALSTDHLPTMDLSTDSLTTERVPTTQPTTVPAMDPSTDMPTTPMSHSTDMDLSTDLPTVTTAIDLSTNSVRTIDASTMTIPTMTVARPGRDDRTRSGGKPTVTIAAGIGAGITGILIIAILCVCIACMIKRVQVNVHCERTGRSSDNRHQENPPHSSGTPMQMNAAYRRAVPTSNVAATTSPSNAHSMQHNLAYRSQDQVHEGTMEAGSVGDYERMSGYIAFHHGHPTHREEERTCSHVHTALPMVYVVPVQQGLSNQDDNDEHYYEYIK